jgi:hypothetical protein
MTVRHESADLQDTSNSFHVSHNDMAQDIAPVAIPTVIGPFASIPRNASSSMHHAFVL